MHIHSILPATGIDKAYSYKCDEQLAVGTYVKISFGRQDVVGVVTDNDAVADISLNKIKSIDEIYDAPPLSSEMMNYIDRVATWTMTPRGLILKMVIPSYKLLEPPKKPLQYVCANIGQRNNVSLNDDQQHAADILKGKIGQGYSCSLLDGVTGAGKTEVFFEAVAEALASESQILIMMPEISLTGGFLDRFEKRFGVRAALWHSQMTPKQRMTVWQGVAKGITRAVIGARSSLFLPYTNLGLIVVDEEHDPSYKQEDNVIYHARDMAVMHGAMFKHPVILASATPSLETTHNVQIKRYDHVKLPDRFGGAMMPDMHIVDMRHDVPEKGEFISPTLHVAIQETIKMPSSFGLTKRPFDMNDNDPLVKPKDGVKREQVLLFLNRRGYAPLTLCRSCGARLECPQCTSWLVEHKKSGRTFCHHCDYGGRSPKKCPTCDAEDSLIPIGPGVERIAEEIENHYPDARVMVLSSDTTEEGQSLQDKLDIIQKGDVDIIIGTQMMAKGHHFPKLTCVGVIDADIGMKGGDLRAGERTWQLLHQVAGRAGREVLGEGRKGQVYLQTYMPENAIMQSLADHNRDAFVMLEMENRRSAAMPPFTRLAGIILSGKNEKSVEAVGRLLAQTAPRSDDFIVMGPAVPAFAMLRGKHRRRLLVQAKRAINLQKTLADWVARVDVPSSVRLTIDIDPQGFL
jgi:primosomal protein N' (replication factor Y) (superfamily II helicase)